MKMHRFFFVLAFDSRDCCSNFKYMILIVTFGWSIKIQTKKLSSFFYIFDVIKCCYKLLSSTGVLLQATTFESLLEPAISEDLTSLYAI